MSTAEIVICGAGMAGIAAAYELAVRRGIDRLVLIDEREPLSLTSSKGTEAYRNWFPSAPMVRFMNRSIDLLDALDRDSGGAFELNRRGYVFLTADRQESARLAAAAREISAFGAEAEHRPDPPAIRHLYPFLREDALAMLHVRRAGWMNAKKLGAWLLQRAIDRGVRVLRDRVARIHLEHDRFRSVELASGGRIAANSFVLAAGPLLADWVEPLRLRIPIVNELHAKIAFEDDAGVIPRDVPLMIWNDPVDLGPSRGLYPAGVHFRPRGERTLLGIWTYDARIEFPQFPPKFDPQYPELILRALTAMVPGLERYISRASEAIVDGGYYCKAPDNRPLIGPLEIQNTYLLGALTGYGVMSSQAAAELVAAHLTGTQLPEYAPAFAVDRPIDPTIGAREGQL